MNRKCHWSRKEISFLFKIQRFKVRDFLQSELTRTSGDLEIQHPFIRTAVFPRMLSMPYVTSLVLFSCWNVMNNHLSDTSVGRGISSGTKPNLRDEQQQDFFFTITSNSECPSTKERNKFLIQNSILDQDWNLWSSMVFVYDIQFVFHIKYAMPVNSFKHGQICICPYCFSCFTTRGVSGSGAPQSCINRPNKKPNWHMCPPKLSGLCGNAHQNQRCHLLAPLVSRCHGHAPMP